jgi:hypothetical protein
MMYTYSFDIILEPNDRIEQVNPVKTQRSSSFRKSRVALSVPNMTYESVSARCSSVALCHAVG